MKLSDLLQSLTEGTRHFEAQMDEWGKNLTAQGNDLMAKADAWQKSADQRSKEWAAQLSAYEAARLAVMLPNPKGAEKNPQSAYLNRRTATIAARMRYAEIP